MPLHAYGVLAGRVVESRREGDPDPTPHYQVHVVDQASVDYRVAVNVKSKLAPSELVYCVVDGYAHPMLGQLPHPLSGWTDLALIAGEPRLDYVRANLFDPTSMCCLPADRPGADNDLSDLFDHYVGRAVDDPEASIYVFGERWGPETQTSDKVFGFRPGNGVHDVHMNQGNCDQFRGDDGVWQDGGLLFSFANSWVAVFLAFQSQSWHTDDRTGHAIDGPARDEADLRVVAAAVNPAGPAPEHETVLLINTTPDPVDLTGWSVADRAKNTCPLPAVSIGPGEPLRVGIEPPVQLGNRGGVVTLLDPAGLKVHGVAYTREEALREGWTIVF